MSHLDEGTLHALLDGELGSTELMEIEAHLGGCAACSARLRDAREFLEEADRLVGSVQFGRFEASAPAAAAPAAPAPAPRVDVAAAAASRPPAQPPREHHPWDDSSPVLLIPDNPESAPLIRRWPRAIGWAATIAVAVSGGYFVSNMSKEQPIPPASLPASAPALASAAESDAVAPRATPSREDSEPTALADEKVLERPPAAAPPGAAKVTPAKPTPAKTPAVARELASKTAGPAQGKVAGAAVNEDTLDQREEAATRAAEQEAIRVQAAQALTQLDRERRVSRAAAATNALDRVGVVGQSSPIAAAPAPPPPTIEQRAQVYLRIGLDEANKQLGGPVHVIEGMSPLFMGLAPGRVAVGADTSRPVVRVVYQDPQGRIILLDQQRNRPGQAASPPAGSWSLGDLTVGLQGEAPAEVLRTLRSRVR